MIVSLRSRIVFLFVCGIVLVVAFVVFVLSTEISKNYRALFIQQGENIAEQLVVKTERLLHLGLLPDEFSGYSRLCQELAGSTEAVVYVALTHAETPLYHSSMVSSIESKVSANHQISSFRDNEFLVIVPIDALPSGYAIEVLIDAQLVSEKVVQLIIKVLSYAAIVAVVILLGVLLFLKANLGDSLNELVLHIQQIDFIDGKRKEWTLPDRKDEIGIVARAFNSLMDRLADSQASLSQANEKLVVLANDLERQVRLRTDELEVANNSLKSVAQTDSLTGLPNRWFFDSVYEKRFEHARRHGNNFAIFMVDLDGFKKINDLYGHAAGDTALATLGKRFAHAFRRSDSCFRIGGDEFVFLAEEFADRADLCLFAEKIAEQIKSPLIYENSALELGVFELGASIGIALLDTDNLCSSELLTRADEAMYTAKKNGLDYVFSDTVDS